MAPVRAWMAAFVLVAAGGIVGLLALAPNPAQSPTPARCRVLEGDPAAPLACLEGRRADILSAELAGALAPWACQLYRRTIERPAELDEVRCAELHAQGLRQEVRGFDEGFFIPLYCSVSLLVVGALVANTRLVKAVPRRRLQGLALVLTVVTALLAVADRQENRALLGALDRMDAWGVTSWLGQTPPDAAAVAVAATATRHASTWKWAASALWALVLGGALSSLVWRAWPADQAGQSPAPALWRALAWLPLVLCGASALALLAAVWGLLPTDATTLPGGALRRPAELITWGLSASILAQLVAALLMAIALWRRRRPPAGRDG
jgi:hypothetical protein